MARVRASRDGLLVVVAAVVLHYEGLVAIGRHYARLRERAEGPWPGRRAVLKVLIGLIGLTCWLLLQWPAVGDIDGVESAQPLELVYFSEISFTTVGPDPLSRGRRSFMLIAWSASFTCLHMARHWREEEGSE